MDAWTKSMASACTERALGDRSPMKALTVQQPWASAIVHGLKDVENRSWRTDYRGWIYIHAGSACFKAFDPYAWAASRGLDLVDGPLGCIVGAARLIDCVRASQSPWAIEGQWHWILDEAIALDPFSCKGALKLWDPPKGVPRLP